jgi:hypothetical protein
MNNYFNKFLMGSTCATNFCSYEEEQKECHIIHKKEVYIYIYIYNEMYSLQIMINKIINSIHVQ